MTLRNGTPETLLLTVSVWFATLLVVFVSYHGSKTSERCFHIVICILVAAVGNIIIITTHTTGPMFAMCKPSTIYNRGRSFNSLHKSHPYGYSPTFSNYPGMDHVVFSSSISQTCSCRRGLWYVWECGRYLQIIHVSSIRWVAICSRRNRARVYVCFVPLLRL